MSKILKLMLLMALFYGISINAKYLMVPSEKTTELSYKYFNELKKASLKKKEVGFNAYFSAKKYGLAETAFSISWQETNFGELQIGINKNNTWDCGIYGLNSLSSLAKASKERTARNKKFKTKT